MICKTDLIRITAQQVVNSEGQAFVDEMEIEHVVVSKKQMALYN